MNRKLPILIAATISLSILATNISVNSAIAKRTHEGETGYGGYGGMPYGYGGMPYGGMGHGGTGQVIQGGCTEHRIFGCATHWLTHKRIDYDKCVVRKK